MAVINPYLTFNGNCEEAFNFYEKLFKKEISYLGRFSEMPQSEYEVTEGDKNKIMHVSLPISDETVLMGSDTTEKFGSVNIGNNITISIMAEFEEEANKLFEDLSREGNVIMPMQKQFWGSLYGMVVDKFGIGWSISHQLEEENK